MDSLKLDGFPEFERTRRAEWMKLSRSARAAITRLHHTIGHKPRAVMLQILRGARANKELIESVKFFKCDACEANKVKDRVRKGRIALVENPHTSRALK